MVDEIEVEKKSEVDDCCSGVVKKKEGGGFWSGLVYGLVPHAGCVAFILFSVFGVTAFAGFFRPLLMNSYLFYILIGLSFVFATFSAVFYLRRFGLLSAKGVRSKWKYLSVLYGTTIFVNLVLFMVVFPVAANFAAANGGDTAGVGSGLVNLSLKVDIPCPGHAALIIGDLQKVAGVSSVRFSFPDLFDLRFDPSKVSEDDILGLDVFKEFKASVVGGDVFSSAVSQPKASGCGCGGCGGSGSCNINLNSLK